MISKFVLGTAQLGMRYGINNQSGLPSESEARALLQIALNRNMEWIDTANAYGESELRIGSYLSINPSPKVKIITKILSKKNTLLSFSKSEINKFVDSAIQKSIKNLCGLRINCCMLHRASDILSHDGLIFNRMSEHLSFGTFDNLGVSVQSPEELEIALNLKNVNFIQMPFNILDWRWSDLIKKIRLEKSKRDLKIHVRSVLLQGLLLSDVDYQWCSANVLDHRNILKWLDEMTVILGRSSRADLCLGFVYSQDWVDGLVIGVETVNQLNEILCLFANPIISNRDLELLMVSKPIVKLETLNPSMWVQHIY